MSIDDVINRTREECGRHNENASPIKSVDVGNDQYDVTDSDLIMTSEWWDHVNNVILRHAVTNHARSLATNATNA